MKLRFYSSFVFETLRGGGVRGTVDPLPFVNRSWLEIHDVRYVGRKLKNPVTKSNTLLNGGVGGGLVNRYGPR